MIGGIVLAAGASTRMGRPKQLVSYCGRTLLHRAVDAALGASLDPVVVVIGSSAEQIRPALEGLPVEIAINAEWSEGMASSIRTGIRALERGWPDSRAALLMACDQVRMDAGILTRIVEAFDAPPCPPMVACRYAETIGVPALFDRSMFEDLRRLEGDRGAKALLEGDPEHVRSVSWPDGAVDLDSGNFPPPAGRDRTG